MSYFFLEDVLNLGMSDPGRLAYLPKLCGCISSETTKIISGSVSADSQYYRTHTELRGGKAKYLINF